MAFEVHPPTHACCCTTVLFCVWKLVSDTLQWGFCDSLRPLRDSGQRERGGTDSCTSLSLLLSGSYCSFGVFNQVSIVNLPPYTPSQMSTLKLWSNLPRPQAFKGPVPMKSLCKHLEMWSFEFMHSFASFYDCFCTLRVAPFNQIVVVHLSAYPFRSKSGFTESHRWFW